MGARSQTGDYSDVKVITPDREIPWNELSLINDEEMKRLMREVVNKLYTVLLNWEDADFLRALLEAGARYTAKWDPPEEVSMLGGQKPAG